MKCCVLGRMLWPSHADFWGAGSGHRGSSELVRFPLSLGWGDSRATAKALSPAACPLWWAGPLTPIPRGELGVSRSLLLCGAPGSRGRKYALRPARAGRPHRIASAELAPVSPVPGKHVWGSGRLPSDYFQGCARVACLPSVLPVWIVHLATPDHHGGWTFCDIFSRLLCLIPFHGNRVQM